MSIKSPEIQTLSTNCCNDVDSLPSLLASQFRLPAAGRPATPRPSAPLAVHGRSRNPERSHDRTSHGRSIRPLPTFCKGLYEYTPVDAGLRNRYAKAWRSECSFSGSNWDAVWCFALHWQWTRTEVCFKAVATFRKQYCNLTNACRAQCGTSQPTQAPNEGMRTTASRGPTFFNSESQARASQLRARGMGPASYVGAPHEGRRIPGPNMGR